MSFQPRRVMITGGAGFIGSELVRVALADPGVARVVVLDAWTYATDVRRLDDLDDPRLVLVKDDVRKVHRVARVLRDEAIDTIVHAAAESHVDRSIASPLHVVDTNVMGTASMLQAATRTWEHREDVRFHHVSTDEVFGDRAGERPPAHPDDRFEPSSPYAASKAGADLLVGAWARTFGLPVTTSFGSNTYGPLQHAEKFIPTLVTAAVLGLPLPIYGDGAQVRDWLYVTDHAEGIWACVRRGPLGGRYSLAGDCPKSNLELAHEVCGILDEIAPQAAPHIRLLRFVQDRPGHDRRYAMDSAQSNAGLDWRPRVAWAEGLRQTVCGLYAHAQKQKSRT